MQKISTGLGEIALLTVFITSRARLLVEVPASLAEVPYDSRHNTKRRPAGMTSEKLRVAPVERFLNSRSWLKSRKELFPNEYPYGQSKAHLYDSRSVQGSSDLTQHTVEVSQITTPQTAPNRAQGAVHDASPGGVLE